MKINEVKYIPIGIIHSPFKEPKGTPIQASAAKDVEGTVEVFHNYVKGLKDIEGFSHIILLYHFHLSDKFTLHVRPFLDNRVRGVFATRAPARPNPIGISTLQLLKVEKEIIHVRDIDIVDNTPLLDIKPYVSEFDVREVEKKGWLKENIAGLYDTKDDGRFVS